MLKLVRSLPRSLPSLGAATSFAIATIYGLTIVGQDNGLQNSASSDDSRNSADLLLDADETQFALNFSNFEKQGQPGISRLVSEIDRTVSPDASDEAKEKLAKRKANAAVALIRMGVPEKV